MYRVLIIEDDIFMRGALENIIKTIGGFKIVQLADAEQNSDELCEIKDIDIVFLDSIIAQKSSVDICEKIKAANSSIDIYIISSYKTDAHMETFFKIGISEYITIPLTYSKINALLKTYLEKQTLVMEKAELRQVIDVIINKHYEDAYEKALAAVMVILEDDSSEYEEQMMSFAKEVQHMTEVLCNRHLNFESKLIVEEALADNRIYWVFWLLDLMDYALQMVAITECEILDNVFITIDSTLSESTKLEQIAKLCNISEGYLNKKIREYFGISTMVYIQLKKINLAKRWIVLSSIKLGDIAYSLGYNENSYFTKVFKKYAGVTPMEYRKSMKTLQ